MGEAYKTHIKIGEQHIDSEEFDEIILKGKLQYPAIRLKTEGPVSQYAFNAIKNSIDLTVGDYYFYVVVGDKTLCIGKLNLDIETVYRVETLLRRLKPEIRVCESIDDNFKQVKSSDLVDTIEIDL